MFYGPPDVTYIKPAEIRLLHILIHTRLPACLTTHLATRTFNLSEKLFNAHRVISPTVRGTRSLSIHLSSERNANPEQPQKNHSQSYLQHRQ